MSNANDIEIFVCDCSIAELRGWLSTVIGLLSDFEEAGEALICRSGDVGLIITPAIENGPFTSIWFSGIGTPWLTHVECARQAAQQLHVRVRCDPGDEFPEVHLYSDVVLEIQNGTERLIEWEYLPSKQSQSIDQ